MRSQFRPCLILIGALTTIAADQTGVVLHDSREIVLLDGAKIGSIHTTVTDEAGTGRLRAHSDLDLNFRCYGTPVRIRREYSDVETSDGQVLSLAINQLQGQGKQLSLVGTVEGDRMHVVVDGGRIERRLRWSDEVVGLAAQDRLLLERRPKAGDHFSFPRYEPTFNTVVNVRVTVKEREAVGDKGQKLLRVEFQPDKIEAGGNSVQPSGWVLWVDDGFRPVRRELELDGVGRVTVVAAGGESAARTPDKSIDIGLRNLVPLNHPIARPHETRSAVYRITLKDSSAAAFARDGHQEVRNSRGNSFELLVHPVRPQAGAGPGPATDEYLAPNYYVDSDDAVLRDMARRAVGGENDALTKARRIERWVFQSMQPASGMALVPASRVARELRGDCRAYALLTTALCRAEGIPSRTALGLIYVERDGVGPCLGFHMWTEACLGGKWVGFDGTLGQGAIGACHVKVSDHSWYATRSLTPLLPVERVLGRVTAQIVSVDGDR